MRWKQTLESNRRKQIEDDENVRASCWKTKRKEKSFSFLLPLDGSDAGETRVSFYPRCSCSFDNNLTTFRDKKRERIGGNSSEDGRRIVIIVSGRATLFNPWECFMFRHLCHLPPRLGWESFDIQRLLVIDKMFTFNFKHSFNDIHSSPREVALFLQVS